MKIVHVTPYFQPQLGYEEYYLTKEQKNHDHEVCIVTSDRYGPYKDPMKPYLGGRVAKQGVFIEEGIKVYRLPCVYETGAYLLVKGVRCSLKEIKPDIVHAHEVQSVISAIPSFSKGKMGYKYVIDTHSFMKSSLYRNVQGRLLYELLKKTLFEYAVRKSDLVTAITPACRKLFSDEYGIPVANIPVVPLGVDMKSFRPDSAKKQQTRMKLAIRDDETVIIFVGNMEILKRVEYLLYSTAFLIRKGKKVKLLLIGGGVTSYLDKLKSLAHDLGIPSNVIFYGKVHRTQLPQFYNAADVAAWPASRTIAIIEALSMGLPIVVPRRWPSGGYPYPDDAYERGLVAYGNGLCFEEGNMEELTGCLEMLVDDDKQRKEMGKRSRRLAEDKFDWSIIADRYLELYEKVLKGR